MERNFKGFTLVELLVAVAILAVLTVVGLMVINPVAQFNKTRDARRKSDLAQIKRALLMYHNDEGEYPSTDAFLSSGTAWTRPAHPDVIYMKTVPVDPSAGYYSYSLTAPEEYCLWATLQNTIDPDIAESQTRCADACGTLYGGTIPAEGYVVCVD